MNAGGAFRSCLYAGQVFHRRTRPQQHCLKYSVFTMLIDLSETDQLARSLWLFSHNRFNLFSFHDRDFGESDSAEESLTDYVSRKLSSAGIHITPTSVLLSCYPRVLGYAFNPLSLFYCMDENGCCFAVLHEVHNTFGERHAYVLPVVEPSPAHVAPVEAHAHTVVTPPGSGWIHQQASKELFVSPFAHMGMHYQFRLNTPADKQVIVIRAFDNEGLLITASYAATRQTLNARRLVRYFFTYPLLSAKVILGIHWEALRLWLKGIPLFRHQPKSSA